MTEQDARRPYDVVVIGASAAGLRAAELMGQAGQRVLVVERRRRLDGIERTWIVTPHLERVLGCRPGESVVHRTGVMRLFAGRSARDVQLHSPDLVVERARL